MKWFKRTILSVIRRPGKTLLLFLVVFVMANLLSGSLAIVQTSNSIKQHLRESIAPKVAMEFENYYEVDGRPYFRELDFETLKKYLNKAREISQHENVVKYEEALHTYAISAYTNDLGLAGPNDELSFSTYGINVIEPTEFVDPIPTIPGGISTLSPR